MHLWLTDRLAVLYFSVAVGIRLRGDMDMDRRHCLGLSMGLLDGLKGLLRRDTPSRCQDISFDAIVESDVRPVLPILRPLQNVYSALFQHLNTDCYRWKEPKEIKTFECLILAKFLLAYALDRTYRDKLPRHELSRYQIAIEDAFRRLLESTFQSRFTYNVVQDTVTNRLDLYRQVMDESSHPVCWQILTSVATGVDYTAERDLPTLIASSLALSKLLMDAQDALKEAVG